MEKPKLLVIGGGLTQEVAQAVKDCLSGDVQLVGVLTLRNAAEALEKLPKITLSEIEPVKKKEETRRPGSFSQRRISPSTSNGRPRPPIKPKRGQR